MIVLRGTSHGICIGPAWPKIPAFHLPGYGRFDAAGSLTNSATTPRRNNLLLREFLSPVACTVLRIRFGEVVSFEGGEMIELSRTQHRCRSTLQIKIG